MSRTTCSSKTSRRSSSPMLPVCSRTCAAVSIKSMEIFAPQMTSFVKETPRHIRRQAAPALVRSTAAVAVARLRSQCLDGTGDRSPGDRRRNIRGPLGAEDGLTSAPLAPERDRRVPFVSRSGSGRRVTPGSAGHVHETDSPPGHERTAGIAAPPNRGRDSPSRSPVRVVSSDRRWQRCSSSRDTKCVAWSGRSRHGLRSRSPGTSAAGHDRRGTLAGVEAGDQSRG